MATMVVRDRNGIGLRNFADYLAHAQAALKIGRGVLFCFLSHHRTAGPDAGIESAGFDQHDLIPSEFSSSRSDSLQPSSACLEAL